MTISATTDPGRDYSDCERTFPTITLRQTATAQLPASKNEVRIILLGRPGAGKSSTANTILGEKEFAVHSKRSFSPMTTKCQEAFSSVWQKGTGIKVVDTPGISDTLRSPEAIMEVIKFSDPGPHALLYVMKIGRITEEEYYNYKMLKTYLGKDITKYMIIVFTHGDELEKSNKKFEDLMDQAPKELTQVISECGHRYVVFNNVSEYPETQVDHLSRMVSKVMSENGRPYVHHHETEYGKTNARRDVMGPQTGEKTCRKAHSGNEHYPIIPEMNTTQEAKTEKEKVRELLKSLKAANEKEEEKLVKQKKSVFNKLVSTLPKLQTEKRKQPHTWKAKQDRREMMERTHARHSGCSYSAKSV